ncbi:MAG TPA: hypothetical protein PLV91_05020, partial [Verrucomicrobiota bacterium]|nr:hypothetical protein [Verrucomicrobiota bacterium]
MKNITNCTTAQLHNCTTAQLHNCNKIASYYVLIVTVISNSILKKLSCMKQQAILLKSYVVFLALFLFLSSLSAFATSPVSDFTYEIR